ncbi:MAG TPA: GNAT family N-acetyltransferase [Actinomycetes bacterium]|nr:GNAT family N-acetyltransferase [Actinomycetes bacterium]
MVEWTGHVVLATSRLLLRTFRVDDLPTYAALNADPDVTRFLGGPIPAAESDAIAAWANERFAQEGIGLLAVERRADGAFLGMCGVAHEEWYPDDVQLGWRLAREHWGHGYATEAGRAWLTYALSHHPRVLAVTDVENARSRAVAERLGMALLAEEDLLIEGDVVPCATYVAVARRT